MIDNKAAIAVLLENQRLMNENPTNTTDLAQFKRISIPLVRRIYPQLIANKIVGVQPMTGDLPVMAEDTVASRKKQIRKKRYRSIDDAWEQS